jgi:periplasmic protein TonB
VKPRYPNDAFVNKTEGTVLVEIVIDAEGRVVRARIVRSVPGLDEAALQAVRQWHFTAPHAGRPVAMRAMARVGFRIQ